MYKFSNLCRSITKSCRTVISDASRDAALPILSILLHEFGDWEGGRERDTERKKEREREREGGVEGREKEIEMRERRKTMVVMMMI